MVELKARKNAARALKMLGEGTGQRNGHEDLRNKDVKCRGINDFEDF